MQNLKKPEVIFFDWDNTLALNRDVVVSAMNKVLAKYGKDDWEKTKKEKRDINKSLKENFVNFFGAELEKQAYNDYLNFYNEFSSLLKAPNNAKEMLKLLVNKGIKVIKFFPAESFGGISTIKALSAPFADIKFMPTGGISAKNLENYLIFDRIIACGGSWMVKDDLIKGRRFEEIRRLTEETVQLVASIRRKASEEFV